MPEKQSKDYDDLLQEVTEDFNELSKKIDRIDKRIKKNRKEINSVKLIAITGLLFTTATLIITATSPANKVLKYIGKKKMAETKGKE